MYTPEKPLTLEALKAVPFGDVFASGVIENSPEGLNMVGEPYIGRKLLWAAVKGLAPYHDWAIYCHWEECGLDKVLKYGDKLTFESNIKKVVPCTDEVFRHYRL